MQDPKGDDNSATSEGIFVYVNARSRFAAMQPRRGDRMRVTGRVGEFKGQTQISAPTEIEILGRETPIEPLAIELTADTNWEALRKAGLKHLNLRLPPEDRYSFSFDGLFGSLDHALATPSLDAQITGFGEWHINADEPRFNVYSLVKTADFVLEPYRASDHDPFVIGLNLTP